MERIRSTMVNRHIGRVLSDVMRGKSFVITYHGRPFGVISPVASDMDLTGIEESLIGQRPPAPEGDSAA